MIYLTETDVLFMHSVVIDETGGSHGVRDLGLMRSAVAQPQQSFGGHDLYPTLEEKAAALLASLARNHPFVDGNKRTAVTAMGVFLSTNGRRLNCSNQELIDFALSAATSKEEPKKLAGWIRLHVEKSKP